MDGLVSWWDFRGGYGTLTLIDRIGGNDGTITNADANVFWQDGKGRGVLDGVDEFIEIEGTIVGTGNCSFEIWYNPSSTGIVTAETYDAATANYPWLQIFHSTGGASATSRLRFQYRDDNNSRSFICPIDDSSENSTPLGVWYHVLAVKDTSEMRIYVNGELEGTLSIAPNYGTYTIVNRYAIGSQYLNGWSVFIQANIRTVRTYNRALSDSEVKFNYEATRRE